MRLPIVTVILLLACVSANIADINEFRIQPLKLSIKERFVFSDWSSDSNLKNAKIGFDIRVQARNHGDQKMRIYIIEADMQVAERLDSMITLEKGQGTCNNAADLDRIFKPYINELAAYESLTLPLKEKYMQFKKNFEVQFEGVYYTIFIYAPETENRNLRASNIIPDSSPHVSIFGQIQF